MAGSRKDDLDGRAALGARLAGLRAAAGYTQWTFAPLVFYGRSSIANIETGRQTAPQAFWVRCDSVLGTGGLLTAAHQSLVAANWQRHSQRGESHQLYKRNDSPPAQPPLLGALLAHIAAVAEASGLSPATSGSGRRRIAGTDVARLVAVTDLYRSVDREHGGGLLFRQLADVAEAATLWLDPGQAIVEPSSRRRLATAVADARMMAGWTAFDAGCYEDSQRHFVLAERAAILAGDPVLTARVRYCQARQLQHRFHNIDALHTVQFAREDLGVAATPALLTTLLGTEAASLAALGRREDALMCLERASDAFAEINPEREPIWMPSFDAGELFAQYGRVYRDLARQERGQQLLHPAPDTSYAAQAVEWVRRALDSFDSGNARSILLNRIGLCSSLMLADEPHQAIAVGTELLPAAMAVSSRRVAERVRNLGRDFGRHRHRSDVGAFVEIINNEWPGR